MMRIGGVPAVAAELIKHDLLDTEAMTCTGRTIGENCRGAQIEDERVIRPYDQPLKKDAGFIVLKGNLFDAAIMKTSVISPEFREHRSEEHTSELQSLMRISYAVFCLKKKNNKLQK